MADPARSGMEGGEEDGREEGEEEEEEDKGVLLSVVLDGVKGESYLLVLDARDLREVARADVGRGRVVGFGFHGVHVKEYKAAEV